MGLLAGVRAAREAYLSGECGAEEAEHAAAGLAARVRAVAAEA